MLVRSALDRAPAPAPKLALAGTPAQASLCSSTRNIGIRPHSPELQGWPSTMQAHFSPRKVQEFFFNVPDVFKCKRRFFQCKRRFFQCKRQKFQVLKIRKWRRPWNLWFSTLHNFGKIRPFIQTSIFLLCGDVTLKGVVPPLYSFQFQFNESFYLE